MQQMQYKAPNRMYVFQNFSGVLPPDPILVVDPDSGPLPSKIVATRLHACPFTPRLL